MERIVAIIAAAGHGTRMGNAFDRPKQFLSLRGKEVFLRSAEAFLPYADEIVVVSDPEWQTHVAETLCALKDRVLKARAQGETGIRTVDFRLAQGGATRTESVYAGLIAAKGADVVMIHDSARCLVDPATIEASLASAIRLGSGIAAIPAKDTVKEAAREETAVRVVATPDRRTLYLIQTPQSFRYTAILPAYEQAIRCLKTDPITDDAMALERFGHQPVYLTPGSDRNLKITTPLDFRIAEILLEEP